jgi:hypothetical protein
MSSIASQRPSSLAQAAQADLVAIAQGSGLQSIYRRWNAQDGAGEELTIFVIDPGKVPQVLALAGTVSVRQPTNAFQTITLMVPRCVDAAELEGSNRVSPSGAVYDLKAGDTFEVPGWAANQLDKTTVKLRVPDRIGMLGQANYIVEATA